MEQLIVVLFLIFFALDFLIEFVLNELNLRFVRARSAEKDIPDSFRGKISPNAYEKSVEYSLAKGRFQRWTEIYSRAVTLVVLFSGVLSLLDRLAGGLAQKYSLGSYGQGILFCLAIGLLFLSRAFRRDFTRPLASKPGLASTKPPSAFTSVTSSKGSFWFC